MAVSLDGGPARALQRMSAMTWRLDLPAADAAKLLVTARSADGQTWSVTGTVPLAAAPPGVRLDAGPPQPPLRRVWLASTGVPRFMTGGLVLADSRLYLGLPDAALPPQNGLVCLDAFSGRTLWSAPADGAILRAPVVAGGRAFAVTAHSVVYAWDAVNGGLLWRRELTPGYPGRHRWAHTGLAAWRDRLLVPVAGGPVLLVRQQDGAPLGRAAGRWRVHRGPDGGGRPGAAAHRRRARGGRPAEWPAALVHAASAGAARGSGGRRPAGLSARGRPAWLDLADGALRWQTPVATTGLDPGDPTVLGATVYLPGQRPTAYRAFNGQPDGPEAAGPVAGPVAAAGDLLWHASADGVLSAWRAADGGEVWRTDVGLPLKAGPLVAGNAVFVVDLDGNVHAYVSLPR
ncbi:MAG: PQQ-binding-like beta-propeller repeat protein [Gammaproteobacteria bacterium]|nr:PQQ-binding-like beta-propeller repeat protein [Gammaproteobacteria bacterium]